MREDLTAGQTLDIGDEAVARKKEEDGGKIEQDGVVVDLLASVVSQLHTVQGHYFWSYF